MNITYQTGKAMAKMMLQTNSVTADLQWVGRPNSSTPKDGYPRTFGDRPPAGSFIQVAEDAEGLGIQWREVFEGVALMEEEAMRRQVRGRK